MFDLRKMEDIEGQLFTRIIRKVSFDARMQNSV